MNLDRAMTVAVRYSYPNEEAALNVISFLRSANPRFNLKTITRALQNRPLEVVQLLFPDSTVPSLMQYWRVMNQAALNPDRRVPEYCLTSLKFAFDSRAYLQAALELKTDAERERAFAYLAEIGIPFRPDELTPLFVRPLLNCKNATVDALRFLANKGIRSQSRELLDWMIWRNRPGIVRFILSEYCPDYPVSRVVHLTWSSFRPADPNVWDTFQIAVEKGYVFSDEDISEAFRNVNTKMPFNISHRIFRFMLKQRDNKISAELRSTLVERHGDERLLALGF